MGYVPPDLKYGRAARHEPLKRSHRIIILAIAAGFLIIGSLIGAMIWELDQIRQALGN